jgi:hypothetical protein
MRLRTSVRIQDPFRQSKPQYNVVEQILKTTSSEDLALARGLTGQEFHFKKASYIRTPRIIRILEENGKLRTKERQLLLFMMRFALGYVSYNELKRHLQNRLPLEELAKLYAYLADKSHHKRARALIIIFYLYGLSRTFIANGLRINPRTVKRNSKKRREEGSVIWRDGEQTKKKKKRRSQSVRNSRMDREELLRGFDRWYAGMKWHWFGRLTFERKAIPLWIVDRAFDTWMHEVLSGDGDLSFRWFKVSEYRTAREILSLNIFFRSSRMTSKYVWMAHWKQLVSGEADITYSFTSKGAKQYLENAVHRESEFELEYDYQN